MKADITNTRRSRTNSAGIPLLGASNCLDLQDLRRQPKNGWAKFPLDRPKQHQLGFADVSISAWVWIYTCLRISICKRNSKEELGFAS